MSSPPQCGYDYDGVYRPSSIPYMVNPAPETRTPCVSLQNTARWIPDNVRELRRKPRCESGALRSPAPKH